MNRSAADLLVFKRVLAEFASRGGKARAKKLTKQRRSEIARKASRARWGKKEKAIA